MEVKDRGDYTSDERENGDSDGDLVNEGASCSRGFYPATFKRLKEAWTDFDKSTKPEEIT